MEKVSVAFLSEDRDNVLERLQEQGVVEVRNIEGKGDFLKSVDIDIDLLSSLFMRSEKVYRDFAAAIKRQGFLETLLGERFERPVSVKRDEMEEIIKNAEKVVTHAEKNIEKFGKDLEENKKLREGLKTDIKVMGNLRGFDFDLLLIGSLSKTFVFTGRLKAEQLPSVKAELANLRLYICSQVIENGDNVMLVLGLKSDEENVRKLLLKHDFEFFELKGLKGKPVKIIEEKQREIEWLKEKEEYTSRKRKEFVNEWWTEVEKTYVILRAYKERMRSLRMFQETRYVSVLEGWMPKKYEWKVQKALYEATSKRVFFSFEEVEDAPTDLENPGFIEKFEMITGGFGLPGYKETDPTVFLAFLFPVFFGFMLGDIFYGLLILFLSFPIKFYFRNKLADIFSGILLLCGISTIVWGILFGNFLGNLLGLQSIWFDPTRNPVMLIIISIVFGFVHVNMGIVLSLVQKVRAKKSVIQEISWFLLEAGGLLIILRFLGMLTEILFYAGILVFVAGVGIKVSKPIRTISLIGFFGNILSYVRLAAISLATSYIALTVNHISSIFASSSFVISGLVFAVGHVFNCAISAVGAFINSLRLHYVEFFSQFFEGEGKEFKPLKYEGIEVK